MISVLALCLTLQIDRLDRGLYQAELGGGSIAREGELCVYNSIADAIRGEVEALPEGMCHFVEVLYCGLSSGSVPVGVVPQKAEEIATHLVALVAALHLLEWT
ncbi:hypothetical protein [Hydrogenophaga sp. ZJX-1]|uniref:hypothetical protein n=1 Tax=Hydrogenophaga sp. ZJX-1 TaxID=3404778 RepID=UPI003B281171